MPNFIKKIKEKIRLLIRTIQKISTVICLIVVYIVGFGMTLVIAMIFNRRLLRRKKATESSFWNKAEGYEFDVNESMRQS